MKPSLFDLVALAETHQYVPLAATLGVPVETTTDSRKGAATPRKRPRRVFKKLAARGFRAHFEGTTTFTTDQVKTTRLCLQSLPRNSHRLPRRLRVQLFPMLLRDGQLQRAPLGDGYQASITMVPRRPVISVHDWAKDALCITEREVYQARNYLSEADVLYPVPVTLSLATLVYAMDGADVEAVLEPPMSRVLRSFALAASRSTYTKVITRQTSYGRMA